MMEGAGKMDSLRVYLHKRMEDVAAMEAHSSDLPSREPALRTAVRSQSPVTATSWSYTSPLWILHSIHVEATFLSQPLPSSDRAQQGS